MKWKRSKSSNKDVVDIRGASSGGRSGGGLSIPGGLGGLGGGAGVVVVLVVIAIQVFGGGGGGGGGSALDDIGQILLGGQAPGANNPEPIPPGEDPDLELKEFSSYVFNDAQDTWSQTFSQSDENYDKAELVLYSGGVSTGGCGSAGSSAGPFYCPADSRVYIDLSFYEDMKRQLGASGDFAWAYVIAHEMGHHVQNVSGLDAGHGAGAESDSVRTELQADCYSGVWAATVFQEGALEAGDLDEAFTASEAVGDDRLQSQAGGGVDPDSFTHGTSEQRREWFERGYESGDPADCDTFSVENL
jgi:predicted metalloprotease